MTKTNRSQMLRMTVGLFTILVIGLTPTYAAAQDFYSFFNRYTGTALTTGPLNCDGCMLMTSIFVNSRMQQWQQMPDTFNLPNGIQISSMATFRDVDVASHLSGVPGIPAVQYSQLPFSDLLHIQFQLWTIVQRFVAPNGLPYRWIRNNATGLCLQDQGQIGVGGGVMLNPCDPNDWRQQWGVYYHMTGKFQ